MTEMRARIKQLLPHLFLIDDAGEGTCYLLCGSERALLIDTANGQENLKEIVEKLTHLPVTVINTHGHCDHIYGNVYFEKAYLHARDLPLMEAHFGFFKEYMDEHHLSPCPVQTIEIGDTLDLGDLTVEIVDLKGHTPGSIGILDKKDRILFSGDGCNNHLWMQLDESLSMAELEETLVLLKQQHAEDFDFILTGHARDLAPKAMLDKLMKGVRELREGKTEKDLPYNYFGGQCLQHPLSDIPGECIVYWESKL